MVQSWVRRTHFKSLQARGRFRRQLTASTLFNCQTDAKWTSSGTTYFCTDPKLKINRTYKQAKAKVRLKTIHANEILRGFLRGHMASTSLLSTSSHTLSLALVLRASSVPHAVHVDQTVHGALARPSLHALFSTMRAASPRMWPALRSLSSA